jgi:hypothetical protein
MGSGVEFSPSENPLGVLDKWAYDDCDGGVEGVDGPKMFGVEGVDAAVELLATDVGTKPRERTVFNGVVCTSGATTEGEKPKPEGTPNSSSHA